MKIAFIGLGQMGKGMALNMLKSGAEMIVCATRDRYFQEFTSRGAKATTKLADTAEADIIFLCLPGAPEVKSVICMEPIFPLLRKGQIVVDFSTINYKVSLEIARLLEEKGVYFIDAPISGLEQRANDGTLTVMCGGDEKAFESVKSYLDFVGNKILYMGGPGKGQLTKLINQLLLNINMAALAEVLPMAVKLGLDCEKVGEVINSSTGGSNVSKTFIPRILERNFFGGGLKMNLAYKDMISVSEITSEFAIPMPVLGAATSTYQMAMRNGFGECDKGGMVQVFENLLGVSYQKNSKR